MSKAGYGRKKQLALVRNPKGVGRAANKKRGARKQPSSGLGPAAMAAAAALSGQRKKRKKSKKRK